jgi:hypothetical protein
MRKLAVPVLILGCLLSSGCIGYIGPGRGGGHYYHHHDWR